MRILTRADAQARGLTWRHLQRPPFYRLLHGVYVESATPPRPVDYVRAVRSFAPDAVATGRSALAISGAPIGSLFPLQVATTARIRRPGVAPVPLRAEHGRELVAPPAVALADAQFGVLDRLAAADWLLRSKVTSRRALLAAGLGTIAEMASEVPESVQESKSRGLFWLWGLPAPAMQFVVTDDGEFVARVDFAWPGHLVCAEYEGVQHATDPEQWAKDIRRYERLAALGWHVVRITAADVRQPDDLMYRLTSALCARGPLLRRRRCDARTLTESSGQRAA